MAMVKPYSSRAKPNKPIPNFKCKWYKSKYVPGMRCTCLDEHGFTTRSLNFPRVIITTSYLSNVCHVIFMGNDMSLVNFIALSFIKLVFIFATENCKFMFPSSFTQRAWSFMREMPSRMMILVITSNSMLLLDDCALLRNDTYSNKEKKVRRMPRQNLNLMQRYIRNVNGTIRV